MNTKTVYPKSTILKEFIHFFLFIEKNDYTKTSQVCYPNTNHCLSLMKHSEICKIDEHNYKITPSNFNTSYLTGIYKNPINITVGHPYKELCINFNPLGLEKVFGTKLSSFIFENNPLSNIENTKWQILFEIVFSNNSISEILNEIEDFFITNLKDDAVKNRSLNLNTISHNIKVEELSDLIHKSYRSTHRFFKNEFQLTPKDFLQIKKIRNGMNSLFEDKSVTEIAYDLQFTDQAHFIKSFKKYTNLTPLQFKKQALNENQALIWSLQ